MGSLDSSRDLQPIHAKSFVNRLHLVLHACIETFDVTVFLRLWVGTKQSPKWEWYRHISKVRGVRPIWTIEKIYDAYIFFKAPLAGRPKSAKLKWLAIHESRSVNSDDWWDLDLSCAGCDLSHTRTCSTRIFLVVTSDTPFRAHHIASSSTVTNKDKQ